MAADLLAFTTALVVSFSLTVPVRRLALRIGMVDMPSPRKVHRTPIPLLGGLAIYSSVILGLLVSMHPSARTQVVGVLAGATLLVAVGILDDRGLLHHQIKLFVGMPLAGVILLASGVRAEVFSVFWPGTTGQWLDAALTILWITGITAAFSILDHMDGLCAGTAAIASAFYAALAVLNGQVLVSTLAAAVLGGALGFLRWNFNPAKIFLGDGGAMFLGFLMATLGLKLRLAEMPCEATWMIPVLILGVPVLDTTLISISRSRRGLIPFTSPGKDHAAHRLAGLGLGPRGAVLSLYAWGALCGLLALLISRLAATQAWTVAAMWLVAMLAAIAALEAVPYERQSKKAT